MTRAPWKESAVELAGQLRKGTLSSSEVIDSVAARVNELNPNLNAIVDDLLEEAPAQAAEADRKRERGEPLGPLHGVPVTVKINVDFKGRATTNGVPAFADLIAPADSPVVRNLKQAGAIVIGRTNTPEFSMRATTDNPLHGRTINPWDEKLSPGGSSGGAGVSAAAGFGPIHHGNDIGGSLRFPSLANGVATVKPTFGRVPSFNPSATIERGMLAQLMSVQGVICREVRDVRLGLKVLAAGDPNDPWWVPAPFDNWPDSQERRIVLTREVYGYPVHPDVLTALETAASHLEDAGYEICEEKTPSVLQAAQGWLDVAMYELRETLGPLAKQVGSETIQRIFDYCYQLGNLVDADGYRSAIADRTGMTREWNLFLEEYPLILSPFLLIPTFPYDYDAQGLEQCRDLFEAARYSLAVNYMGLPAGILPMGRAGGAPTGIQLIGRRYREDLILDAMENIEERTGVMAHELWETL